MSDHPAFPPSGGPSGPPPMPQSLPQYYPVPVPARRAPRRWWLVGLLVAGIVVFGLVALSGLVSTLEAGAGGAMAANLHETELDSGDSPDKLVVIPVQGVIAGEAMRGRSSLPELVKQQLKRAAADPRVKGVILKVNSPGGEVLASDDIYRMIADFQQNPTNAKPVIAYFDSMAASGGYYVSAGCRWIVAHELTITGSIGVIMHGYNYRALMDKVGVRPEVFKSGKFKDMLSGDRREEDITKEERQMMQALIDETYARFKTVVRDGRALAARLGRNAVPGNQARPLAADWETYADGRVFSGREAQRLGFVDEVGTFDVARKRAERIAGIQGTATLVQYTTPVDLFSMFSPFGQARSGETTVKLDMGVELPRLNAGYLYFMLPVAAR